jgi:uncharacterized membrane protein YoaK (UPF0700 family)
MKVPVPVLLSFNAGYVDTAGFLALHGLFAAHVTGNFVTLAATVVTGDTGAATKLAALPLFCLGVAAARVTGRGLATSGIEPLRILLGAKLLLLIIAAALAISVGPFPDLDSWPALATGMSLVLAMAIQNAVQRVHLKSVAPTTMMTGNTTQVIMDFADMITGVGARETRRQLLNLGRNVGGFAIGCGTAALLFDIVNVWCFAPPPLVVLITLLPAARPEFV